MPLRALSQGKSVALVTDAGTPGISDPGFLPVKPGRRLHRLEWLKALETTVVCYESPHWLLASLEAIGRVFREVEMVVARELTRQFEEIPGGTPSELGERFGKEAVRGEFTEIIPYTRKRC